MIKRWIILCLLLVISLSSCNLSKIPTEIPLVQPTKSSLTSAPEEAALPSEEASSTVPSKDSEPTPGETSEKTRVSSDVGQLCSLNVPEALPIGAGPDAPLQFTQDGYSAEWFVPPSPFNMPLEIMLTAADEILVQSVRSNTLYRVTLEGEVSVYTNLISGYLGDVDAQGNAYTYSAPGGVIWRGSEGGRGEEFVRSPLLDTPCSSGFGFASDGNFYVAYNPCADQSVLYMVTQEKQVLPVNPRIPPMVALASSPDGRFYGASYNHIYEISLTDFQVTDLYEVPMKSGVAESGMTFDETGNIYLSTGTRDGSGQLWQVSPFGDIQMIAEIPGNGLSGIEYLSSTDEIIGAQLIQGSLLAVSVETGEIREIIRGNGLITPMALGFSVCGDLVVSNDDGGIMILVDPAGSVQRFFSYLSYTPPVPYLAISAENAVYASECAPGLSNGIIIMTHRGDQPKDFLRGLTPSGMVWLPDVGLVVAETLAGQVLQIDTDGNRRVLAEGLEFPQSLAVGPRGEIYVAVGGNIISEALPAPFNAESIFKVLPDGSIQELADVPDGLFGLAVSPTGDLYAATWKQVLKINPDGGYMVFASGFEGAVGLAFDLSGNMYISDHVANGIVRISGFPYGILGVQVRDQDGEALPGTVVRVFNTQLTVRGLAVKVDENGMVTLTASPGLYSVVVLEGMEEIARVDGVVVLEGETKEIQIVVE